MDNQYASACFKWSNDSSQVFVFKSGLPPVPVKFDIYLYLTQRHIFWQTSKEIYHFYLFRNGQTTSSAIFQCAAGTGGTWFSPARAPFGGIQAEENCLLEEITFLLNCVEQWLVKNGSKKLTIKTAPFYYNRRMLKEW